MKKLFLSFIGLLVLLPVSCQSPIRKFVLNLSDDGACILTCYFPENPTGRAIVDCPGGGYSHLAINHEGHQWAEYFTKQGIAFFVLQYRMPHGDRNIPLNDAYKAMRLVRDSAEVWHINKKDVGIMGFSAGGHLASAVSTHADESARPNFTILFYPVISMDDSISHKGSCENFLGEERFKNPDLVREYSSDKAVRPQVTPRAIILLSNDDKTVPPVTNGVAYYAAMHDAGNECELHVYPSGGHGWGIRPIFKHHEQMLDDLTAWLRGLPRPEVKSENKESVVQQQEKQKSERKQLASMKRKRK